MTSYPTPKLILDKTLSATLLVVLSPVFGFLFAAMGVDMLVRRRDRVRGSIGNGGSREAESSTS